MRWRVGLPWRAMSIAIIASIVGLGSGGIGSPTAAAVAGDAGTSWRSVPLGSDYVPTHAATPWLAIDSGGHEHIVVQNNYTGFEGRLYYFNNLGGAWTAGNGEDTGFSGCAPRIFAEPDGTIDLTYVVTDIVNGGLYHATRKTGVWTTERTTLGFSNPCVYTALMDGAGTLYVLAGCTGLGATTHTGATWTPRCMPGNPAGQIIASGLDTANVLHILYTTGPGDIYEANLSSGTWSTPTATGLSVSNAVAGSLVVDSAGAVHAFVDDSNWNILELTDETGTWVRTPLNLTGSSLSVGIDSGDRIHLYFVSEQSGSHGYYTAKWHGAWTAPELTPFDRDTMLAVDKSDRPHVVGSNRPYAGFITTSQVFDLYRLPIDRYWGADRFATAASISARTFTDSAAVDAVYIANAYNFPDALAGAAAAGKVRGPILLASATGALDPSTIAELTRLHPTKIVVLGGPAAIGDGVFSALQTYSATVVRYFGATRFGTAADISSKTFADAASADVAYIAYAYNFPDALAGAAAAAVVHGPVLLATSDAPLDSSTYGELLRLQPKRIIMLGGIGVLHQSVWDALTAYSGDVTRYAGVDRFGTAAKISEMTFTPANADVAYIANAYNFPDALAGASAAGLVHGPVLLADSTGALSPSTVAELTRLHVRRIVVLGGSGVISDSVFEALKATFS